MTKTNYYCLIFRIKTGNTINNIIRYHSINFDHEEELMDAVHSLLNQYFLEIEKEFGATPELKSINKLN